MPNCESKWGTANLKNLVIFPLNSLNHANLGNQSHSQKLFQVLQRYLHPCFCNTRSLSFS